MDASTNFMPWIFGAITLIGVVYFLYSIVFGGASDAADLNDLDVSDIGTDVGDTESGTQLGCMVIAAFLSGFGAIGLLGTLSNWGLPATIGVALAIGLVIGHIVMRTLRFVTRQQTANVASGNALIGSSARVTIDTPAGKTGEAMLEEEFVGKYPVKEINSAALQRGDKVEVVNFEGGVLYVKRKRD
jgi:membrane protein implicated in regulation of membrane protease activity